MRNIKYKLIAFIMLAVCSIGLTQFSARADAAVYVSVSSGSVTKGSSVTVSLSVSGGDISAYTLYLSYDSSVLSFNSVSGAIGNGGGGTVTISGTGAGNVSISFTAVGNGTSGLYTSGEFYDINFNQLNVSYGSASVTVTDSQSTPEPTTEVDNRSSNNYLSNLEVNKGTLEPAFEPSVTEYTLRVAEDVTDIEVVAYPSDSKAKVSVSGNTELSPGIHYVTVRCTAENGYYRDYTIKVVVGEVLEDNLITVDGVEYNLVTDAEEISALEEFAVPEGYEQSTAKYGKWDILVYKSKSGSVLLACLKDADGNYGWFRYDEKTQEFSKYIEYKLDANRYVLLNIPEGTVMPEGYVLTEITIAGVTITAYTSEELGENYYIIYAVNIMGDEGFYLYDAVEGNIIRYVLASPTDAEDEATAMEPVATKTDEEASSEDKIFTKSQFMLACIITGSVVLILLILIIVLSVRVSMLKHAEEDEISDIETLSDERSDIPQVVLAATEEDAETENAEADGTEAETENAEADADNNETETENAEADADNTAAETENAEADADNTAAETENAETDADNTVADTENAEADADGAETDAGAEDDATSQISDPESRELAEGTSEADIPDTADDTESSYPRKKKSSFEISDAEETIEETISGSLQSEAEKEQFENLAKEIEEKINSDYDASLDSAFSDNE